MFQRLLRVLYIIEFFISLSGIYNLWSTVGGAHLDYMAWYWKLIFPLLAAYASVRLTMVLVSESPNQRRHIVMWLIILLLVTCGAGLTTYYYHLNEPNDQDDEQSGTATKASVHARHRFLYDIDACPVVRPEFLRGSRVMPPLS